MDILSNIESQSVDMILCDLPYGTTQNKWDSLLPLEPLWNEYRRICIGAIVLTAQSPFDKVLGCSNLDWLKYEWIWEKESGTGFLNAKKAPLKSHENILVFYDRQPIYNPQFRTGFKPYKCKQGATKSANYGQQAGAITESDGSRYPLTVLRFNRDKNKVHPTQKPVALFEYLIKTYTNPGGTVLDNCAGSGTTAIAAIRSGREYICIEKDPNYFQIAKDRISAAEKEVAAAKEPGEPEQPSLF